MALKFYDVGEHCYFIVPSGSSDGFVILDHESGCEAVDGDGEVVDEQTSRWPRYATEREAEEAIERWRLAEEDRKGFRQMVRLFESCEADRLARLATGQTIPDAP